MPTPLPVHPNLDRYRTQAKELLVACDAGDAEALARVHAHRRRDGGPVLSDAQLALAREHGFESWSQFKDAVEQAPQLRAALDPGDPERVRQILEQVPQLADFVPWPEHRPGASALDIISAQCVWHRPRKHEIARTLIAAHASCDITRAARAGLVDHVGALLDDDPARLHATDDRGRSALYRAACVYGQFPEGEAAADLLLARGAEADLYVAATFCMAERVEALLADDPEAARRPDPEGMTALHWAARPRRQRDTGRPARVVELLLDAGADVRAANPTEEGMLPLHHVAEWPGTPAQADLLIAAGADVNAPAGNGWTPLDYAIDRSRAEIAQVLQARGGRESGRR